MISAPAGYGKTSLIAEWIQQSRSAEPPLLFTWLSLDEQQNNPGQVLHYLPAAIQKIVPGIDGRTAELISSSREQMNEAAVAVLVNQFATQTEKDDLIGRPLLAANS